MNKFYYFPSLQGLANYGNGQAFTFASDSESAARQILDEWLNYYRENYLYSEEELNTAILLALSQEELEERDLDDLYHNYLRFYKELTNPNTTVEIREYPFQITVAIQGSQ